MRRYWGICIVLPVREQMKNRLGFSSVLDIHRYLVYECMDEEIGVAYISERNYLPSPIRRIRSLRKNGTIGLWFACRGPFLGALLPWGLGAGPLRGGAGLPRARGASLILLVLRGMILEYWRFEVGDQRIYAGVKTAGPARPIKDPNYYLA